MKTANTIMTLLTSACCVVMAGMAPVTLWGFNRMFAIAVGVLLLDHGRLLYKEFCK